MHKVFSQVIKALSFVHSQGNIAHRDIKPENIVFGPGEQAFLIDFGVAKILHEEDNEKYTTGDRGTKAYMSPEITLRKLKDFSAKDHKANDMWAFGVTIY